MANNKPKPDNHTPRQPGSDDLEDLLAHVKAPLDRDVIDGGMKRLARFLGRAEK